MQERTFDIADIISLIVDADFGNGQQGVLDLASFLTGLTVDGIDELNRVRRSCIMAMRRQHDDLTFILHPRIFATRDDALEFLEHMTRVHGHFMAFVPVTCLPPVRVLAPAAH